MSLKTMLFALAAAVGLLAGGASAEEPATGAPLVSYRIAIWHTDHDKKWREVETTAVTLDGKSVPVSLSVTTVYLVHETVPDIGLPRTHSQLVWLTPTVKEGTIQTHVRAERPADKTPFEADIEFKRQGSGWSKPVELTIDGHTMLEVAAGQE